MTNLTHISFFYMFISILYMFRATSCLSSGESIVSIQHQVMCYSGQVIVWYAGRGGGPDLHTRRSPTQSDTYQMYWCKWFSSWWARGCSKRVENWNKCTEKRIVRQVGHLQERLWAFLPRRALILLVIVLFCIVLIFLLCCGRGSYKLGGLLINVGTTYSST
jgi:hypothetical protein